MTRTVPSSAETLPPIALTPEQAAAIAMALAARPDGPYAAEGRAALDIVLAALEPDPRRRAGLLAGSREVTAQAASSADLRELLDRAVAGRRVLVLRYRDGRGRGTRREVEPQLLIRSSEHWFLVAWCRERQALRWFRSDRIESAELTDETAPQRDLAGLGAPPPARHPAGRALRTPQEAPPRLVLLPGGRAGT